MQQYKMIDRYYKIRVERGFIEYITTDEVNNKTQFGTNFDIKYARKYSFDSARRLRLKLLKYGEPFVEVIEFEDGKEVSRKKYTEKKCEKELKQIEKVDYFGDLMLMNKKITDLSDREMLIICEKNKCNEKCPLCFKKEYPSVQYCAMTNTFKKLNLVFEKASKEYNEFKEREVKIVC